MAKKTKKAKPLTLEDLEIRYKSLREKNPQMPNCSFKGCVNPLDWTGRMGWDTSCSYHRLLHDYFLYEVDETKHHYNTPGGLSVGEYREMFRAWVKKTGKKRCDKIVVKMMSDVLNWAC